MNKIVVYNKQAYTYKQSVAETIYCSLHVITTITPLPSFSNHSN